MSKMRISAGQEACHEPEEFIIGSTWAYTIT